MSFVLMLILLMFGGDLLFWRWAHRVIRSVGCARVRRLVLGFFMVGQIGLLLILLVGRMMGGRPDAVVPRMVLVGVFLWHFILLPVGVLIAVLWGTAAGAVSLRRKFVVAPATVESNPRPSRRQFLGSAAAIVPPLATALATGVSLRQLDDFRIRSFDLKLAGLPEALNGMRIAQVSDIHVGQFTTERILRRIVESTNNLRADLVLLTGDLINFGHSDLSGALDAVKRMDSHSGLYMIQGNHDLMEGREQFDARVRQSGVPLLVNESAIVQVRGHPVQLLGLRWGPARGDAAIAESMSVLLPQIRPDAFPILMAHHPHAFDPAAAAKIPLTLSGHTHGGQIMPMGIGFGPLMYRYWTGLYEKGNSELIVSNGVGNWFPLRINAPAEIVEITLRSS